MTLAIKLASLILVCAAGILSYILLTLVAIRLGLFPNTESIASPDALRLGYFGGGMWAWIAGNLMGITYLFIERPIKKWFFWAPLYLPLLYMVGALAYFKG